MSGFDLSKADFGIIATAGFWTYALAVAFNGPLADRIGGKKSILIGAAGACVLNLIIGLLFLNVTGSEFIGLFLVLTGRHEAGHPATTLTGI